MKVFRIANDNYIHDLTGIGARIYGGRWNLKGTSVIYTAESRALASVELLVHLPLSIIPGDLKIACIEIPDKITPQIVDVPDLPDNWRDYPPPNQLAVIGTNWAIETASLLLRVPSAVVEDEYNILINPLHPDFKSIKIIDTKKYSFDDRLLR